MFRFCTLLLLIASLHSTFQGSVDDNEIDTGDGLENVIQNFLSSKAGQELGKTLFSMGANSNANQILDGIGAVLGNGAEGNGQIDPSFLSSALNLMLANAGGTNESGGDSPILPWIIELFAKEGGVENLKNLFPTILSSINSFVEEAAGKDKLENEWILPMVDKVRELVTHQMDSETGRAIMASIKGSDAMKVVLDKSGNFNVEKVFTLLENHSTRKKAIEAITRKIGEVGERLFDPSIRSIIIMGIQTNANQILRNQGFPKNADFDIENPIDSISAIINYAIKRYFGYQIRSKQYVKPAYKYLKNIYDEVQYKGYFSGKKMTGSDLSNNLADIINLEIIEPFIRAFRAYRFSKKLSKCDKYVMCLVNKDIVDATVQLPIVKMVLTKGASLVGSWFISNETGTSFWTLYSYIMEDKDCEQVHFKSCDQFHEDEMMATRKLAHTEL